MITPMPTDQSESRGFIGGIILAGISLILAVSFEYLLFDKTPGIGFPLFVLLILAGACIAARQRRFEPELLWAVVPVLFFSWMVFVRASELLTVLNMLACFFLLILFLDLLSGRKIRTFMMHEYADIAVLPLKFFRPMAQTVSDIVSLRGVHRHSDTLSKILKGLFMAVPVLLVFGILFSSADLLFSKYVSELLSLNISPDTIALGVRLIIITCAFLGAYSYIAGAASRAAEKGRGPVFPLSLGMLEVSIFLGAICVLFLLFILIQLVYLFGGDGNVTVQGFTYAEYARRGFFELIAVAIFSFVILWKTEQSLPRRENLHHGQLFKILSGVLVLEVLIIMFSAHTRLSLYETAYGFTTLRLYSHVFIVLLCAVFLILFWKISLDGRENVFALRIFLACMGFLVFMNLLNPDAFIARQNIKQFGGTPDKLDIGYLVQLSEDAVPDIIDVLPKDPDDAIYGRLLHERSQHGYPWQSMNIARLRARQLLEVSERQRYYK